MCQIYQLDAIQCIFGGRTRSSSEINACGRENIIKIILCVSAAVSTILRTEPPKTQRTKGAWRPLEMANGKMKIE